MAEPKYGYHPLVLSGMRSIAAAEADQRRSDKEAIAAKYGVSIYDLPTHLDALIEALRTDLEAAQNRADKAAEDVVDIASQLEHAEATITRLQDKWTSVIFSPEPGADY